MSGLPMVCLGNSEILITRLISGGNPLCGNSHISVQMDADMSAYFNAEQVIAYLHRLQTAGINTIQARGDYHRVLYWLELFRREGGRLNWIAQTASEMHDLSQNIRVIAAAGAAGIYHHGTQTDKCWLDGRIDRVQEDLKRIRDTGAQTGLGTHVPEVIEYAEEKGWDVDFYMTCFYNLSRRPRDSALVGGRLDSEAPEVYQAEDPSCMCAVIGQTDKMCLAFKVLAAGRLCATQEQVAGALRFAFDNIKDKDAVVVGMFPKYLDHIGLNVKHAIEACRQEETF